jgi:hypothetical protein
MKPITDIQKRKEWLNEHFSYEAELFIEANDFLLNIPKGTKQFDIDLAIEAMAMHGRNLWEFLYDNSKEGNPHYPRAKLFYQNWNYPKETASVEDFRKRVDEEITHLGWKRFDNPKDKEWGFSYVKDILEQVKIFLDSLEQSDSNYYTDLEKLKALRGKIIAHLEKMKDRKFEGTAYTFASTAHIIEIPKLDD